MASINQVVPVEAEGESGAMFSESSYYKPTTSKSLQFSFNFLTRSQSGDSHHVITTHYVPQIGFHYLNITIKARCYTETIFDQFNYQKDMRNTATNSHLKSIIKLRNSYFCRALFLTKGDLTKARHAINHLFLSPCHDALSLIFSYYWF